MTQAALKYDVEVDEDGRVELRVPFPSGARLTVFVIQEPEPEALYDLVSAAESSLDFWDNSLDDDDWSEA
jgi:hypothetical protein